MHDRERDILWKALQVWSPVCSKKRRESRRKTRSRKRLLAAQTQRRKRRTRKKVSCSKILYGLAAVVQSRKLDHMSANVGS
jgi:hypothetical protein